MTDTNNRKQPNHLVQAFGRFATFTARQAGRPAAFVGAGAIIVVWAACGPIFNYSDTWQLIINTGTTIITFLMVFLIQNSQNRDGVAIQVKLDELIRVSAGKNFFVGIEHLDEDEIERLRQLLEKHTKVRHVGAKADTAIAEQR